MADGQGAEVDPAVSQSNQKRKNPRIARLVDRFMGEVERVADDEDWKESDGWVGRMVLWDGKGKQTYVYEIRDGKMRATDSQAPCTGYPDLHPLPDALRRVVPLARSCAGSLSTETELIAAKSRDSARSSDGRV